MKKCYFFLFSVAALGAVSFGSISAFADSEVEANPASTETPVKVVLELPDNGGENPTPPSTPDDPDKPNPDKPGNKPNNPTGPFGIAYQPDYFNFGTNKLKDSGEQSFKAVVPQSGDKKFHVGVKDKSRETFGWTLKAKLQGAVLNQGATVELKNTKGVQANRGDSSKAILAPIGSEVATAEKNVAVATDEAVVMTGNKGRLHNDVYDYEIDDVTLKIADAKNVAAGTYEGQVVWNLEKAPGV
ncbi:TPA: WxL domain-containing protein [Enterococcus faecalis]